MGYLLLVRHGESRWNLVNKFTGWADVPLSGRGVKEAMVIAKRVKHLKLDVAFTSHLERAHETLLIMLSAQHCTGLFIHEHDHGGMRYPTNTNDDEIPVHMTWHLNERNYGLLQGENKRKAAKKYGYKKVLEWRRGYDEKPPGGESLHDVAKRVVPYFKKHVLPAIEKKQNVLVVAHGNTLRAIIKDIEGISSEKIASLELAPGQPFIYTYNRGKLEKAFEGYSFSRPIEWEI